MTPRELAIARTVIYAALFDYPLTLDQLHVSLIESEQTPEEILAVFDGSESLQHIVEYRDGLFFPAGRDDLLPERRRRETRSLAFLARHRRLLQLLCALPFTRAVALSGSVAHLNLEPNGDLDLFIVTRGPRVWTVTLAAIVLTKLLGRRRDVCINFILADSHLRLEPQDLFTANQVIHLKPLIGADVLATLRADNPFVARVYPNASVGQAPAALAWTFPRWLARAKWSLELVLGLPAPLLEAACRQLYGWHLRRRAATWRSPDQVRLQSDYLKLHTRSHRRTVLDRFDAALALALRQAERLTVRRAAGGRR
ncbi:MAG: hypothetical protein LAO77_17650 [Acidobacteriia bacterium]|nr:hypothetical protein [Terriglobia bacterium]